MFLGDGDVVRVRQACPRMELRENLGAESDHISCLLEKASLSVRKSWHKAETAGQREKINEREERSGNIQIPGSILS